MAKAHDRSGGPAFPFEDDEYFYAGMSLRDWLAGQALAGLAPHVTRDSLAKTCYEIADAMLAQREAKGGA